MKTTAAWVIGSAVVLFVVSCFVASLFIPPASITHCVDDIKQNYSNIQNPEAWCHELRDNNPPMFDDHYKEQP